jgi:L-iditol 2-dehydrogenase
LLSLEKKNKMHAAVFYASNSITYEEAYHDEKGGAGQGRGVSLRVNACAICGYDVRVFRNGHPKVTPPIILGHEICGEIEEDMTIGSTSSVGSTETIKAGSRVAISPIIPCLECIYCDNKQYNLCSNIMEIGSSINGGFAEYVRIPKNILAAGGLVQVPDSLSSEEAALLEPLACCLNGFSHMGPVSEEDNVVIIGDGPIGLLHLQLSRNLYHARTAVVGKIPQRIQKARSMGADATAMVDNHRNDGVGHIDAKSVANILDFTEGIGANTIIIATSDPAAFDFALKIASKNSRINIFSGMNKGSNISFDPNWLHYNQISITGSFSSTPSTLQEAVRLACDQEIDLSKLISRRYSLADIKEAILTTEKCLELRAVISQF